MRLLKLKLTNVYSSLNKEITFNDDLNLLVGINGSGKTTILNFIDWLITPNLARLATTKFEKVELSFFHGEERQTLYATQDSRTMKLYLKEGTKVHPPIVVRLKQDAALLTERTLSQHLQEYSHLGPTD